MTNMDAQDPTHSTSDAFIGKVLRDKWRIVRRIGEGGTSEVFEAVHRNGKRFAVKVLRRELMQYPEAIERLLHEGMIANLVQSPGIVASFDDDVTDNGTPFLVMELLEGRTVEDALDESPGGRMDPGEVCRIGIALLDTLAAVHRAGILHRDLKPGNLFITKEGQLKVLDFGISRVETAPGTHKARLGVAMGTPGYMPAEQAAGDWGTVDTRTDLWAAGAVLFRMLTGTCIYEEETASETLVASMTKGAPPVAHRLPHVSPTLAAVIDKSLQIHLPDRWQSADAMRDAFARALVEVERMASEAAAREPLDSVVPNVQTVAPPKRWSVLEHARKAAAWAGLVGVVAAVVSVVGLAGMRFSSGHVPDANLPNAAAAEMAPLPTRTEFVASSATARTSSSAPRGSASAVHGPSIQPKDPKRSPMPTVEGGWLKESRQHRSAGNKSGSNTARPLPDAGVFDSIYDE
ncbi:MAG: serine/threonine protein kinase [Polyangiaceae bacterium]|nr:serine/threonine protein kinase [Polyangiaceae bacterium]